MLIALLKKWEMAATTTNQRLKAPALLGCLKNDITFPVQLQTLQYIHTSNYCGQEKKVYLCVSY